MRNRYYYTKTDVLNKNGIELINVVFDNHESLALRGSELIEYKVNMYDKLIATDEGIHPFAESGYFKFKIGKYPPLVGSFVVDDKEYKKNRREYLINRCVNGGGIIAIKMFDNYNWSKQIYGNFIALIEDDYLILSIKEKAIYESSNSDMFYIDLPSVLKKNVYTIDIAHLIKLFFVGSCYLVWQYVCVKMSLWIEHCIVLSRIVIRVVFIRSFVSVRLIRVLV